MRLTCVKPGILFSCFNQQSARHIFRSYSTHLSRQEVPVFVEGHSDKNVLLSLCRLQQNGLLADPAEFFDLFSYLEVSIQNCLPLCARGHNFFISIFSIHMACAVLYAFGLLKIRMQTRIFLPFSVGECSDV